MATIAKTITPSNTRLGWISTGIMGQSICSYLIKAGYTLTVACLPCTMATIAETITPSNTRLRWINTGIMGQSICSYLIKAASSHHLVTSQPDIVFSIVGYPSNVCHVLLHPTSGALSVLLPNGILVDITTSEPSLAVKIANSPARKSCFSINAPVSSVDRGACDVVLSIFADNDESTVKRIFSLLGKINYMVVQVKGNLQN
ncbi:6-phosphogluconate dehydrogenase, NADP-binding [Cynara cardunculus var. scolymus]|uniref:6-phosphogluconate dehydrogenase, NADP-binding n=1 Tax=Cynara cardunculus var. scolymus TaxID=59895 RepID=A0A103XQH2_CYNCS|nr:6-phosphogluconate dehydrogenase, NADP-binding [Cynara cardunculus var. scolymus]